MGFARAALNAAASMVPIDAPRREFSITFFRVKKRPRIAKVRVNYSWHPKTFLHQVSLQIKCQKSHPVVYFGAQNPTPKIPRGWLHRPNRPVPLQIQG